ncbi:flavin reductase like domain-containing protein [Tirmania nivea]|nr:flavin reductase like domain-containing protein [Tirmania nivea]
MFGLRRGLRAGCTPRAPLLPVPPLMALARPPARPPATASIPLRHYAKPHKPVFLTPSRRPLPPPTVEHGIVADVQRALRSPDIADQVRGVLRHMVHPVVILTTSTSPSPNDWRAMTLSSFTSLSLDPHPLITFNIKTPSACASAMHARKRFIVHAMLPTTRAADFAARFSNPYVPGQDWKYAVRPNSVEQPMAALHPGEKEQLLKDNDLTKEEIADIEGLCKENKAQVPLSGQFGQIHVLANELTDNLPALREEVMFRLYCTPERTIPVQDHEIWVAKVERIEYPHHHLGTYGIEPYAPLSLLYGDRSFRETGFHMVTAHNKFRRWVRRKMEYEAEIREERKRKLLNRLDRVRRRKAAEEGYAYGELEMGKWAVKQLKSMDNELLEFDSEEAWKWTGKLNEEGEPTEEEEKEVKKGEEEEEEEGKGEEVTDIAKWMERSSEWRLSKRKIIPTPGPDIIPPPPPHVSKPEPSSTPSVSRGIRQEEEDVPLEEKGKEEKARKAHLVEKKGKPNRAPPPTSELGVLPASTKPAAWTAPPEPQSTPSNRDGLGKPKTYSNLRHKLQALQWQQQPNRRSYVVHTSNSPNSSPSIADSPHLNSPPPPPSPPPSQTQPQQPYLSDDPDAECEVSSLEDYLKVSTEEKIKEKNKALHFVRTSPQSPSSLPSPTLTEHQKRQTKMLTPSFMTLTSISLTAASSVSSPQVIRRSFSSASVALSDQGKHSLSSKDENASSPAKISKYITAPFVHYDPSATTPRRFRILRGSVLYSRFSASSEPTNPPPQTPTNPATSTSTSTTSTCTRTSTASSHPTSLATYKPFLRVVRRVLIGPLFDPSKETIYKPIKPALPTPGPLPKIPPPPPPEEGPATFYVYPPPPPLPPNSFPPGMSLNHRLRKLRKRHQQVNRLNFKHDPDILMDEDIVWDTPPPGENGRRKGTGKENEASSPGGRFSKRKDSYELQGWLKYTLRANVSRGQSQNQRRKWGWDGYEDDEEWVWEAPGKREAEKEREVQVAGGRKEQWLRELNWQVLNEKERAEQLEMEMERRARGEDVDGDGREGGKEKRRREEGGQGMEGEDKKPAEKKEGKVKKPHVVEVDAESEAREGAAEECVQESEKGKKKKQPPRSPPPEHMDRELDSWQQKMLKKKRRQAKTKFKERVGRV